MRNNLLLYGINDNSKENWSQTRDKLHELFRSTLKIDPQELAEMPIDRVHRMGKFNQTKARPIFAKFLLTEDKDAIS